MAWDTPPAILVIQVKESLLIPASFGVAALDLRESPRDRLKSFCAMTWLLRVVVRLQSDRPRDDGRTAKRMCQVG